MLSRVADNLYWMSRYLERAEHTARLLDVNVHGVLDHAPLSSGRQWERVLASLRANASFDPVVGVRPATHALTLDPLNPASILFCVSAARDNARQAWEQLSSEMWEQINRLFLYLNQSKTDEVWAAEPHAFFSAVKEGVQLFQGITDATMSHGEGWQFIQVGRGLERASATALLLDTYFASLDPLTDGESPVFFEWVGLLKSCSAFEAYVKIHGPNIEPAGVAAFLLLNAEFPRSVRYVASVVRSGLQAVNRTTGARSAGRPERLAGRLQAALDFAQIEEIMADDIHGHLEFINQQCDQIHTAIYQTFIQASVAAALAARAG